MTIEQLFGHDTSNVSEDHFEKAFGGLLEGVMSGLDNECRVVQSTVAAMTVEVQTGTFITGGAFARVSAQDVLTVPAADAVNPRIDRVICKRDNATNTVTVEYRTGTPAGAPAPAALVRAGGVWEISLAQVYVAALAATITRANIADERRSRAVCGLISPNGSPDALFPLVNNLGQVGGWEGHDTGGAPSLSVWGLLRSGLNWSGAAFVTGLDADGKFVDLQSGAALGNEAGIQSDDVTWRDFDPAILMKWKLPTVITTQRFFCGLHNTLIATIVGSDAPAVSYVGLQYSTIRPDTTWQFVCGDGVGQTIFDSEVAVSTDAFSLRILIDSTAGIAQLDLLDDGGNVVSGCYFDDASDNVPATGADLNVGMALETNVAAMRALRLYYGRLVNRIS